MTKEVDMDLCSGRSDGATDGTITSSDYLTSQTSWSVMHQCTCTFTYISDRGDHANSTFDTFGTGVMASSTPVTFEITFVSKDIEDDTCDPFIVQEGTGRSKTRYHICPGETSETVQFTVSLDRINDRRIVVANEQEKQYRFHMRFRSEYDQFYQ